MQEVASGAELMEDIRFLRELRGHAFDALLERDTRETLARHLAIQSSLDEYERAWAKQKYLRADE